MATAVVSGRIDASLRDKAAPYLKLAGVTAGDVIKTVWKSIAETGQVPQPVEAEAGRASALEEFFSLCDSNTSASDWLATMTDAEMRDILGERDV